MSEISNENKKTHNKKEMMDAARNAALTGEVFLWCITNKTYDQLREVEGCKKLNDREGV